VGGGFELGEEGLGGVGGWEEGVEGDYGYAS